MSEPRYQPYTLNLPRLGDFGLGWCDRCGKWIHGPVAVLKDRGETLVVHEECKQ